MRLAYHKRIITRTVLLFLMISCSTRGYGSEYCQKGDVYKDPKNRFEVICPADKMDVDRYGVYFEDEQNSSFYLVRAYDKPPLRPNVALSIGNVLGDIKSMMASQARIEVLKEEVSVYQGHEAIDFDYIYQQDPPHLLLYPFNKNR
jgi:hypothetical protein